MLLKCSSTWAHHSLPTLIPILYALSSCRYRWCWCLMFWCLLRVCVYVFGCGVCLDAVAIEIVSEKYKLHIISAVLMHAVYAHVLLSCVPWMRERLSLYTQPIRTFEYMRSARAFFFVCLHFRRSNNNACKIVNMYRCEYAWHECDIHIQHLSVSYI